MGVDSCVCGSPAGVGGTALNASRWDSPIM